MRFELTPVVKNLIIINVLMSLAVVTFEMRGVHLIRELGLYYWDSPLFRPWQLITSMFMHASPGAYGGAGISHLLFNMFGLFMFGPMLERRMGSQRFLIFYMICGLGATLLHWTVVTAEIYQMTGQFTFATENGYFVGQDFASLSEGLQDRVKGIYGGPLVGASGALMGVLAGFAMLFPNMPLMLIFLPIPIKAKYFVLGYAVIELLSGFGRIPGDPIAHFAHLGGMLFGYLLMKNWYK